MALSSFFRNIHVDMIGGNWKELALSSPDEFGIVQRWSSPPKGFLKFNFDVVLEETRGWQVWEV